VITVAIDQATVIAVFYRRLIAYAVDVCQQDRSRPGPVTISNDLSSEPKNISIL